MGCPKASWEFDRGIRAELRSVEAAGTRVGI
jgi:hypothetical protein